jgi:molecular chaperone GrpE
MTDPTAPANGDNTAGTADNKPERPDATTPAKEASDAAGLANEAKEGQEVADPAALAKEVAEHKDRLLRTLAEMENLRRRTDREVADARAYGVSNLARDVVGVADNLRRALAAAGESTALAEGPAKSLREGVELIERDLLKVLERYGVKRFDPKGAKFDPNFHQAIFEVADDSIAAGSVAQVIQPGYMIGERVLRPAMVGVAKESPKPATSESPTDDAQTR